MYKSLEVKNNIYWVGALDYDIRVFDIVMYTEYGTTYNSYIVKGKEKTAIIEASKDKFFDEHIERIKDIINPSDIDYLVVNHTEPDHTGAIEKFLEVNPEITIVGSSHAIRFLKEIINKDFNNKVVKDGEEINLGDKVLKFLSVPFLHWPDSMYTYIEDDKTLFTCDSFGCHYCDENVFNDKMENDFIDAYKYYFDCIMGPFKGYVSKALEKIVNLDIETICPGHGPVLRKDIDKYINLYEQWSKTDKNNDIIVCYASAYGYTKKIAEAIVKGITSVGEKVKLFDLEVADKDEVMTNIYLSKAVLIGSPTIVNDAVPPVWNILTSLNPTINRGLQAGAFGSFGWSGEAITNIEQRFKQLNFKVPVESLKIMFNPSEGQLNEAVEFGKKFAEAVK